MQISAYFRGSTDILYGVTFDTEQKRFRAWKLPAEDWTCLYQKLGRTYSGAVDGFSVPGDLNFCLSTKQERDELISRLTSLDFVCDQHMPLCFGKVHPCFERKL